MKVREKFKMPPVLQLGNVINLPCTVRGGMFPDEAFVRVTFHPGAEPFAGYVDKHLILQYKGRSFLRVMLFERPDAKSVTLYIAGEGALVTVPLEWLVQQMMVGGVVYYSPKSREQEGT